MPILAPGDESHGEMPPSTETLAVLLEVAWRKDEALIDGYDQQTTRAGAVIGFCVATTALFGTLLVVDNWIRYGCLVPLCAEFFSCGFAVRAWRVRTLNRAPSRDVLRDYRTWGVEQVQDQLISTLNENLRFNGQIVEQKIRFVKAAYLWAIVGVALFAVLLIIHIFWFPTGSTHHA
jgi:hypothetical protein